MAKKGNKYKIGALALAAVVILVFGLLSLGIMKYFQPEILFMTYTNQSVQGLKNGSNVKIKGVTIGSVKGIKIGLEGERIAIIMKLNLDTLAEQSLHEGEGHFRNVTDIKEYIRNDINKYVKNGLRCQLQYEGITGDMYVDLGYFDPKTYPASTIDLPQNIIAYVPSVPSPNIGSILENTQAIVNKLNSINFQKISDNFETLLVTLNDFTSQIKQIVNKEKVAELEGNINYSLNRFNQVMISLNTLVKTLQRQPDAVIWGKTGNKVVPSLNEKQEAK